MTQAKDRGGEASLQEEEGQGLLSEDYSGEEVIETQSKDTYTNSSSKPTPPPRAPRRESRVRFDLTPEVMSMSDSRQPIRQGGRFSEDGDFDVEDPRESRDYHRTPLLTEMEAPSISLANRLGDDDPEDIAEQERRRPKSGMNAAFMNMANSIIGAGIIGQPYAIRQAGLLAGILLLIGLTIVVDWTICLIVINSKLSGTSSFQGTVQHCFGRTGLIAISVAQWVFAFGGMVAFGVIVGDTIPHVLMAVWPDLSGVPVIGLITDRRVAIAVFCLGISYPLTLYRDIAKVY